MRQRSNGLSSLDEAMDMLFNGCNFFLYPATMFSRAPRFGQIEIPLTLHSIHGQELQCACLNISSTGALLQFLDDRVEPTIGMMFRSKMLQRGQLIEVWMQVERIAEDGIGVRFMPEKVSSNLAP